MPTDSAILDGELCLIDPGGGANFYRLMTQMRTRWPEERLLVFLAFDLLHQDRVDLRSAPLSERKRDLSRHWVKVKCPDWKRDNAERHKLWEGARKPELTKAQEALAKKREEVARVLEWLGSPWLMPGIARELRKHVGILEQEIAELEK